MILTMVRYPQKKTSQPLKPQVEGTPSPVIKDVPKEQDLRVSPKTVPNRKSRGPSRKIFIIVSVFCLLTLLSVLFVRHLYVASIVLELQPKEFNLLGEKNINSISNFVMQQGPPGLMSQAVKLYRMSLSADSDGKSIEARVYSLSPRIAKQFAETWEREYGQKYITYRINFLKNRMAVMNKEYAQTQNQLGGILEQMSKFKPGEKYFLVNASSREKLDGLDKEKALDFEKDFSDIKLQLAGIKRNIALHKWSKENKILLDIFRLQLTEMEFKKFLVGAEFLNFYEEGTRTVKAAAASLINAQAKREHLDITTAALIIKKFFLSCRQQAIEAVLNKRYALSGDELSNRALNYVQLKNKSEACYLRLKNIILVEKQMRETSAKGLSLEVVVKTPLNVTKY